MWRLIFRFIIIAVIAAGIAWLADRPGTARIDWLGYTVEMPMAAVVVAIIVAMALIGLAWRFLSGLAHLPGAVSRFFGGRRKERGRESLSKGIIALGAGDVAAAQKHAQAASRLLPDEPLAQLLKAQSAQLRGDSKTVRRVFEAMLQSPDTEPLGLRGLFNEARRDGDYERARTLAARALKLRPELPWASNAMIAVHSAERDWEAVAGLLESQRRSGVLDTKAANRKKAVVLTAQALEMEDEDPPRALDLAERAHKLAPELVTAAVAVGRLNSGQGNVRRAMRAIEKTWRMTPHRDLAEIYGHVRSGDSAQDRLKRIRGLVDRARSGLEGSIALARVAIEAREWREARRVLEPHLKDAPNATICALMAEIEQGENGDAGKVREWLARAVRAPRDCAWTADGFISEQWLPMSPLTGELDVFVWKVPVEGIAYHADEGDASVDLKPAPVLEAAAPEPTDSAAEPAEAPLEDEARLPGVGRQGDEPVANRPAREPSNIALEDVVPRKGGDGERDDSSDEKSGRGGVHDGDGPTKPTVAVNRKPRVSAADLASQDDVASLSMPPRQPDDPGPDGR